MVYVCVHPLKNVNLFKAGILILDCLCSAKKADKSPTAFTLTFFKQMQKGTKKCNAHMRGSKSQLCCSTLVAGLADFIES